jgi:mannose-6-phosphate isomerase-like protein (cupin superfamily)
MSEPVFSYDQMPWRDVRALLGARGFEFKALVCDEPEYTSAYSCELVRLDPGDHSVPHVEKWNHTLIFLSGTGDVTIKERTWEVMPGTVAKVRAGERHSLRNLGSDEMLVMTIYDPPRPREQGEAT